MTNNIATLADEKAALRAEYIDLIGYDPFEDDPSTTVDDVRETLADYKSIVLECAKSNDGLTTV
jgi:hypothetical protein